MDDDCIHGGVDEFHVADDTVYERIRVSVFSHGADYAQKLHIILPSVGTACRAPTLG